MKDDVSVIELIHSATVQDRNAWKQIAVGLVDAIRAGDEGRMERLSKLVDAHADQTVARLGERDKT